ncbi:bifunctional 3'-5' exonuclease/DNA polymerase [Actinomadura sp. 7K534]|uniref:bifunctional 3'-5' exonuclease/DNA polymerase n=1 Tax=Actinomadura sp. 7K534 TaxID=2530366 RepID=UPI00104CB69B|nr:bifunctional 3'-5' exonuclease/DNA polymerase [Actinomadura sp. 7K534]TDB95208.1 bifunctional 3'-5' exonuclease/DNA polymerase [Actinomadura sp. 7K534]
MKVAVAVGERGGGALRPLAEDGTPAGPVQHVPDLVAAIGERERAESPRWVWPSTARLYPRLLDAGVRVGRCHDLELVESLLLGHAGRYGEPRSVRAAWARSRGEPVPADAPSREKPAQASLFDDDEDGDEPADEIEQVVAVHAEQQRAITGLNDGPGAGGRFALLAAAESAGALAAAEMGHDGLPWSAAEHDALLTELLGPRPSGGLRPRRLQDLADRISAAFGPRTHVNPDSPAQLLKAFASAGHPIPSTRAHVLKGVDHPAVPLLLEYKELARLHTAHGWAWLDTWVSGGRFRPEYVAGGVVSGRWATSGGGALQIPRVLRRAVVADPGWSLVVADAAQLEPRVLAALAGDRAFAEAAAHGDLYAALSGAFDSVPAADDGMSARDKAKLALLSAMYGGGTGEAVRLLAVLRNRFPDAFEYVEAAARAGERGRLVRSRLGRTCPPPSAGWRELTAAGDDGPSAERRGPAAQALRSRGRFTRNFVVQATAADWALALLASLRRRLTALGSGPRLVFFQHDEVIVHTPAEPAANVAAAVRASAEEARRLLFGDTPVVFPMEIAIVDRYADAK